MFKLYLDNVGEYESNMRVVEHGKVMVKSTCVFGISVREIYNLH